jgi:hypothetical protein
MNQHMNKLLSIACFSLALSACDRPSSASPAPPPAPAAPAPSGKEIELVPGASLGPIKLGMTKADVDALGILTVHPQYSGMTIPFTVYYDKDGKARDVEVTLKHATADVKIGTVIIPRTATYDDAKKLLGDCKDNPPAIGGTTTVCRGGGVKVSYGSGSPTEIWIHASKA